MILERILLALLICAIIIASFGVPIFAIQLILCIILVCLTANQRVRTSSAPLLFLMTLICFIDKINDFLVDFDILRNIGPVLYCFFLVKYLLVKQYNNNTIEVRYIFRVSIATFLLELFRNLMSGAEFRFFSSDISTILIFIWVLYMWYGRHKLVASIIVVFLTIFLFEARTMILSISVFLFIYYYWNKVKTHMKKFPQFFLLCELVGVFIVTAYGIWDETIKNGMSNGSGIFSGHGILWGLCLEQYLTGDLINQLFGYPTTPALYEKIFGGINVLYSGNEYIANNSEESLIHGNFHNSFVYYIYNTGIFGLFLLSIVIQKVFKNNQYNFESIGLFSVVLIIAVFNGQSLTSIYLISTIFLLSLFYKFPPMGSLKL